jgi:hypothetical protein
MLKRKGSLKNLEQNENPPFSLKMNDRRWEEG